jgi:murein DD-endopeptidase MepM/ murein hydrolase activator NlpD
MASISFCGGENALAILPGGTKEIVIIPSQWIKQSLAGPVYEIAGLLVLLACRVMILSCRSPSSTIPNLQPANPNSSSNVFDEYLRTEFPPADGFDFAVGDREGKGPYEDKVTGVQYAGWYVATHFGDNYSYGIHPGEDWSGLGPSNSDRGQEVHAIAIGRVAFADFCGKLWGNVVMIDHVFYQNHEKKAIRSVYAHLNEIRTRSGAIVNRRDVIGTVGQDPDKLFAPHLHLELRWDHSLSPTYWPSSNGKDTAWVKEHYANPSAFIKSHRSAALPRRETSLVLVDQASYKMRLYRNAKLQAEFDVSFGQGTGPKRAEGDNRTPVGMYFVIQKHQGSFEGPYGAYYGGYWIKINYPNQFDSNRATREGLISSQQAAMISEQWKNRRPTPQTTKLGGGIGFHGWIKEWTNDGPRHLSFGCVVMHLYDIRKAYDQIPEGSMVVIF